jgi:hypothetical protein
MKQFPNLIALVFSSLAVLACTVTGRRRRELGALSNRWGKTHCSVVSKKEKVFGKIIVNLFSQRSFFIDAHFYIRSFILRLYISHAACPC